jgi:hypothetical protein
MFPTIPTPTAPADYQVTCAGIPTVLSSHMPSGNILTANMPPAIRGGLNCGGNDCETGLVLPYHWKKYEAYITCDYTYIGSSPPTSLSEDLDIPSSTVRFEYSIKETCITDACETVTDTVTPPSLAFSTASTLPGDDSKTVVLPMVGEVLNLNDVTTLSPASLQEHVENQQTNLITTGSIAWSQGIGFQIRLRDANDQQYWRLKPQFLVLTAHATNAAGTPVQDTMSYIDDANGLRLDVGWCGIESGMGSSTVGAIALSDSGGAYQITNTTAFRSYITTELNTLLEDVLSNNMISESGIFDFAGMDSIRSAQEMASKSYVVSTSDGSYTIPFRNRLKIADGSYGGFSVRMCSITHLEPNVSSRRRNRKLLATEFTLNGDVMDQVPVPTSADLNGLVFDPEPRSADNSSEDHHNHDHDHHDHVNDHDGWVVSIIVFVVGFSFAVGQCCW